MRLIDADALAKDMRSWERTRQPVLIYTGTILKGINNAPTIDAVPVVRCKDCKWWKKGDFMAGYTIEKMECGGYCPNARFSRYESDFCSYGERKDGAEDGQ